MGTNVYEEAEGLLRAALGRRRNRESCVKLGIWLLRKHGPHGYERRFSVPRQELAKARGFADQVGLTESQIRGAVAALEAVGFLVRTCGRFKKLNSPYDLPTLFVFGMTYAALFPAAKNPGVSPADSEVVRSTPLTRHNEDSRVLIKAPLIVATKDHPFGRPVIPRRKKTRDDYEKAMQEAREAHLRDLARLPLPSLSTAALRLFQGNARLF